MIFEGYFSPHQESGEEEDVPEGTAEVFLSTQPPCSRDEREADGYTGYALLRFTKDMSRAYVDVKFTAENLTVLDEIVMFHLHLGAVYFGA